MKHTEGYRRNRKKWQPDYHLNNLKVPNTYVIHGWAHTMSSCQALIVVVLEVDLLKLNRFRTKMLKNLTKK